MEDDLKNDKYPSVLKNIIYEYIVNICIECGEETIYFNTVQQSSAYIGESYTPGNVCPKCITEEYLICVDCNTFYYPDFDCEHNLCL